MYSLLISNEAFTTSTRNSLFTSIACDFLTN